MKTRPSADRGIIAAYWMVKLADAIEAGDSLLADAARDQLREIGFDVSPVRSRRRRWSCL